MAWFGAVSGSALQAQHIQPSWKSYILTDLLRTKENKQTKKTQPQSARVSSWGSVLETLLAMEAGSRDLEREAGAARCWDMNASQEGKEQGCPLQQTRERDEA